MRAMWLANSNPFSTHTTHSHASPAAVFPKLVTEEDMEEMISEREVRVSEGHSGVCYVCVYICLL